MKRNEKLKVAVWKFSSCDGCQLSILDCEDELLELASKVHIAYFPEATRAVSPGPYDLSLVEGSISTKEDVHRIQKVRKQSKVLVAIGACATSGGIQALKNTANLENFISTVYASPHWIKTLADSTALERHVKVDYELRGCPISKSQLLELITALLVGRKPSIPTGSLCMECKQRGITCVKVRHNVPCMGLVTHAGCGAICPSIGRACYGCFGPTDEANMGAFLREMNQLGVERKTQIRMLKQINANAEPFRTAVESLEKQVNENP